MTRAPPFLFYLNGCTFATTRRIVYTGGTMTDTNDKTIGERVHTVRRRRGFTMQELADRCDVAKSTVVRVENEDVTPSVVTAKKLADALGVSLADLLDGWTHNPT